MNNKKIIYKVSIITIITNVFLSLLKMICGIIGKSQAMISDAIHSISDVFSTVIVIIGAKVSNKGYDKDHPYGHERIECVFSIFLALILALTGMFVGYKGILTLINGNYNKISTPGIIALIAAIISIITKEIMYWYTIKYAKAIKSTSLKADAHHHRSDALSSIGSLIGIIGSRIGFLFLDSIASIIICLFIFKAAFDIFKESIDQMIDKACNEETKKKYINAINKSDGIINIDLFKTRLFGSKVYIDLEISVDKNLSLIAAHNIAKEVHDKLENTFPEIKHCMIHVNPYIEKKDD